MNSGTKTGKTAKRKPKQSPKKAVMRETEDLQDDRKNRNETSDALAYLAKYFDQI